jgi:hypothetical protein
MTDLFVQAVQEKLEARLHPTFRVAAAAAEDLAPLVAAMVWAALKQTPEQPEWSVVSTAEVREAAFKAALAAEVPDA